MQVTSREGRRIPGAVQERTDGLPDEEDKCEVMLMLAVPRMASMVHRAALPALIYCLGLVSFGDLAPFHACTAPFPC